MHIAFYYDFLSPYSYLATTRLAALAPGPGVALQWTPVCLPRLLELAGNVSPVTVPKKARYIVRDLGRWAARLGVPLRLQHPPLFDTEPALLAALALDGAERERFSRAVFSALWGGGVKVAADRDWLAETAAAQGFPPRCARPDDPHRLRALLEETTTRAWRDGAFGVPAFVLRRGGRRELFFGLDRMDFLAEAVAAAQTGAWPRTMQPGGMVSPEK